jgi:hypothetical protein
MKLIRHPLMAPSPAKRLMIFAGSTVLALVLLSALRSLNVTLQTAVAPWGILSFEFAGTVEQSREIIQSWNVAARASAQSSLLLDFVFPLCYSTSLALATFWAAGLFAERGFRKTGWLSSIVAWLQWPAALLDYVENVALLVQLRGSINDPWPGIAYYCASIKFLLIVAAFAVIIAAVIVWALRRRAAGHRDREADASTAARPVPAPAPALPRTLPSEESHKAELPPSRPAPPAPPPV